MITIGCTLNLKLAYEVALFNGKIASPDVSYKTLLRRFKNNDTYIIYDTLRFVSDSEAKYSPIGDVIKITKTNLVI